MIKIFGPNSNRKRVFVSHPRTGSTWLYRLLKFIFKQIREPDFSTRCVKLGRTHDSVFPDTEDGCLYYIDPDSTKPMYKGRIVIFGVRDPKDIVISMWFMFTRRYKWQVYCGMTMEGFIREFIPKICEYHNSWARHRQVPKQFIVLKYEDMVAAPEPNILRVLRELGLKSSRKVVRDVINDSSFQRRQEVDKGRIVGYVYNQDPEMLAVRRGVVGGYVDYVSDELRGWMERYVSDNLHPQWGYT